MNDPAESRRVETAAGTVPLATPHAPVSRRAALKLLGAGAAVACGACDRTREELVPYVRVPEYETPGVALRYATTLRSVHGDAQGVIATTFTGRPTKLDGNPRHPASLGATDVFAQAALVGLYDPERSAAPRRGADLLSAAAFVAALEARAAALRAKRGEGLAVVTPSVHSPAIARALEALFEALPDARWYRYDPVGRDAIRAAAIGTLGRPLDAVYRLERARCVLTLDADLLNGVPGHLAYARRFAAARAEPHTEMPRLYSVESQPTATGVRADHRLALSASRITALAFALAARLGVGRAPAFEGSAAERAWLEAVARDLESRRGASVVVPGPYQPQSVHELCHWLNATLRAADGPLYYVPAIEAEPAAPAGDLESLCKEIAAKRVDTLAIVDRNPVYDAACAAQLMELLPRVTFAMHASLYRDETAERCEWHVPLHHELESWGDGRAFDGTASFAQPLVSPLVEGLSTLDLFGVLSGGERASPERAVREAWRADGEPDDRFTERWREALRVGVLEGTAAASVAASPRGNPPEAPAPPSAGLELQLRPDATLWDGRFARNDWLQELPDPVTTRVWGNAVELAPTVAAAIGVETGALVEIATPSGTKLTAAAYVAPGHPDGAVTLALGYGRADVGRKETASSVNAFRLRTEARQWNVLGATVSRARGRGELILRQPQQTAEGRDPSRRGRLADYLVNPAFLANERPNATLYPEPLVRGEYRWALTIDLNRCIGCAACTIACQAENNIPVVGREQASLGRTMHWIRVDRYHDAVTPAARAVVQPVPCMHCENAPCEYVCPVGATQHDSEGLNVMVYNRCIGTRDCSQNCPYKVRRFNWLEYNYESEQDWSPLRNPNVTVRSRGVMEKCTYCVQRISAARQTAQIENRRIRDGEVVTACQAVCPTEAIVFGDLNTAGSAVNARRADPRGYTLLAELNTRPRTTYLARVDNPNSELEPRAPDAEPREGPA